MEKAGIFYGSSTGNCQIIAELIHKFLGKKFAEVYDIADADISDLLAYNNIILGISTWGDGDLQDDWKEFISKFDTVNLNEKKIALYGLGDQGTYHENFVDGMGILYELLSQKNCSFVGSWPLNGYHFKHSKAIVDGRFVGLALDEDMQYEYTVPRLKKWIAQLKNDFY